MEENKPESNKPQKESPPWKSSSTSHQTKVISTLKRKIDQKNRNNLSGLIKLKKKKEALLRKSITQDQVDYEEKLFKGKKLTELQKYLRSIHEGIRFPDLMSFGNNQVYNDNEKSKLFNKFYCSVFTRDYQLNAIQNFENNDRNK